jgi:gliding motility-associated lipoprotein GldH
MVLLVVSCNQVYKEWDKDSFTTLSWKRGQELHFSPEIRDTTGMYELVLGIRHIYGSRIASIAVSVQIVSPAGTRSVKSYNFPITDSAGKSMASCAGNMCDLETALDTIRFSEPGNYHFVITHVSPQERIRGIMEFGLIINKLE